MKKKEFIFSLSHRKWQELTGLSLGDEEFIVFTMKRKGTQ